MNILKYERYFKNKDKREGEEEKEQEKKEEKKEKTLQEIKQQNPESGTFYRITDSIFQQVSNKTDKTPSYKE